MDEQFDKKLTNRIREVFDNYEAPGADAGWTELRKKFPAKEERKIAWLWWSSAAAILLVFLGVGLWLMNKPDATINVAVKPVTKQHAAPATDTVQKNNNALGQDLAARSPVEGPLPAENSSGILPGIAATNGIGTTKYPIRKKPFISSPGTHPEDFGQPPVIHSEPQPGVVDMPPNSQPQIAVTKTPSVTPPDSTKVIGNVNTQQIAQMTPPVTDPADKPASVVIKQPAKTMADIFNADAKVAAKTPTKEKKELKRVNFSVYAATYFNYAEGSANQVNAGAGVTSDIRLGKNIKLSTGVLVAQNSLKYDNGMPPVASNGRSLAAAADASPSARGETLFAAASTVTELQNYSASLVGLDIPLNLKFEFNPEKNDSYISAGISSGTFIDERYTARYNYKSNGIAGFAITTQDQTTSQSFNSFYFAKTLNLAVGIGTAIGKNRLIIEPFLKYPIGGMGTQDIRFGSGGLNLKFNFTSTKK